jgi:hypothetical protein
MNSQRRTAVDAVIAATCRATLVRPRDTETRCSIQPRPCWRARLRSRGKWEVGNSAAIRARTMGPRRNPTIEMPWTVAVDIAQLHIAYHFDAASQV